MSLNHAADLFTIIVFSLLLFFPTTYKQTFSSPCAWINTLRVFDEDGLVKVKCKAERRLTERDNMAQ